MNKRSSHNIKSISQRQFYHNYIEQINPDPTIDQTINFGPSTETGEELSQPTSNRKRVIPFKDKVSNHFSEHWIEWIIGLVLFIGVYFVFDSRIDIAVLNTDFASQQQHIQGIVTDIDNIIVDMEQQSDSHNEKIEEIKRKLRTIKIFF